MFGRRAKIRKAIDRALARVEAEDDLADPSPIEALPADLRAAAYGSVALALFDDERYAAAEISLGHALALAPGEVELHRLAASIARELGHTDAAIDAQRRVVELSPREAEPVVLLAEMLIAAERIDEAITALEPWRGSQDPAIDMRLAEALFLGDNNEAALEILDDVCEHYTAQLKQLSGADWHALKARADEAARLRDDVYAELHGREATIDLAAAAGKLDASAGVNYRLLGARLAATSERIADVLELEDPDATERRGSRIVENPDATGQARARGLVLVGAAQLRRGEIGEARKTFERACEADGRCFAAFLGFGAALDHEKYDLYRRATKLGPLPPDSPALAAVIPDLPVLTDAERRVVWASVQPLAKLLPRLADEGVTMRILPIDVRATDVGLFEDAAGERGDDHRSYDAISGVATHGGAVAKIEELLDTATDGGWTFAHELAHLAFFHMPEEQAEAVLQLYERALEVGYANTEYALSNPDEFFAVGYADYLRTRHHCDDAPIEDDAGIQAGLAEFFDSLSR